MKTSLTHFVGFRGSAYAQRYANAERIFGPPDMVHDAWDTYAANDAAPWDVVIFAEGEADQKPRSFTVEAQRSREIRNRKRNASLDK